MQKFVAEIDPYELAARFLEAFMAMKRPVGLTAKQAIDGLDPGYRDYIMRGAKACALYLTEVVEKLDPVS